MNRIIPVILGLALSISHAFAQDHNPLINSGELIKQGTKLHDDQKYKEALQLYDQIGPSDTNYVLALYEKALTCDADSQYERSIRYCEEAIALPGDRERLPLLYNEYGNVLDNSGQKDRAIRVFDSAIALYPAYSNLYVNKATTLMRLKDYEKAEKVLQQAVLIDPYSSSGHYKLAISALQLGKSIPAFYGFITYLLISPEGKFTKNCITMLNSISKSQDGVLELINARKDQIPENFQLVEQIVLSKIALDPNYKSLIKLDDPISRQFQVILEKVEYSTDEKDFYMQYYVPVYKALFKENKFEILVNYAFSSVNIPSIAAYVKKNKKEVTALADQAVSYFNQIRNTRELDYNTRSNSSNNYLFINGKLLGKGITTDGGKTMKGPWDVYFAEGNIKATGNFNDKGEKEGVWKYYYFNGMLRGQELYHSGKQEGEERYFHDNGQVSSFGNYSNGHAQGIYTRYNKWGALTALEEYSNDKLNGTRKTFYSSGSIKAIEQYTDDVIEGPFKIYHENGRLSTEGSYIKGKLNGPYKWFHDNGIPAGEGQYENDIQSGAWKRYYESGKLKSTENYQNGKLEGEYAEYHENGQLFVKYMNRKGKTTGEVPYYDKDGKMYSTLFFENDKLKSSKYFDKSGKQLGSSESQGRKMEQNGYNTDGYRWQSGWYDEKGLMDGVWSYYYNSGTLKKTETYKEGSLEGNSTGYYPNKKKSYEFNYRAGEQDGYYTSYYIHGFKEKEGWYKEDEAEGTWMYYDERGTISEKTNYLNGSLNGVKTSYLPNGKVNSEAYYDMGIVQKVTQFDSSGNILYVAKLNHGSGPYKLLHLNGKTAMEGTYVNGNLNGPFTYYYFDGSVRIREFFKGGLQDSIYRTYHYGNILQTEGQYKANEKTGLWKNYNEKGQLYFTEEYKDGKLNGKKIYYYPNGKVEVEIPFKDDSRDGILKSYTEEGTLMYQLRYDEGDHKAYSYLDKNNKLMPEIAIPGDNGPVNAFYPNGNKSAVLVYADGKVNGPDNEYYENGKIKQESTEVYGSSEGMLNFFYPDGKLKSTTNYQYDNPHGPYRKLSEKGTLQEEGNYYSGLYHGAVKYYDDNGHLKETRFYYYGQLINVKK